MKNQSYLIQWTAIFIVGVAPYSVFAARYMENLDRGLVAVYKGGSQVYIGWRMFGTDPSDISFNLYRNGAQIASSITDSTNYLDTSGSLGSTYRVAAVINGVEQELSNPVATWSYFKESGFEGAAGYHDVPLQQIPGDINWEYNPNDASVGDLDGDGE
jgi:rhamnogalacturonan endolyase